MAAGSGGTGDLTWRKLMPALFQAFRHGKLLPLNGRILAIDLDFDKAFAENRVDAYERLLMDVIAGRLDLFVRSDEQEEAWRFVEPILDAWKCDTAGPRPYAAGTWGPAAASALVARDAHAWAEEQ